jgi:predicted negative regulator of RcsB-dependent stress response
MNNESIYAYESALYLLKKDNLSNSNFMANNNFINKMQDINKKFPNSKFIPLIQLQIAIVAFENNNLKISIKNYNLFLKNYKKNSKLKPLALIGLAYAYEANQNFEQALLVFEDIIKNKFGIIEDTIIWESARLAYKLDKISLARIRIMQLQNEYPQSDFILYANKVLKNIK